MYNNYDDIFQVNEKHYDSKNTQVEKFVLKIRLSFYSEIFELNQTLLTKSIRDKQMNILSQEFWSYLFTTACMNSSRNSSYSFPVTRFCRKPK